MSGDSSRGSSVLLTGLSGNIDPIDLLHSSESDLDSVPARFALQVSAHRQELAIVGQESALTYDALDKQANRIAHAIRNVSTQPRIRVALLLAPGPNAIAAMLGALKAGAIYVPLDPAYPHARTTYMIQEAQATLLLTDPNNRAEALRLAAEDCPILDIEEIPLSLPDTDPGLLLDPDAPAYILYTSGSTGQPKGVVQTHRNLLHFIDSYTQGVGIRAGDRLSLLYSLSFSASLMDIYGSLLNGATLYHYDLKQRGLNALPDWLRQQEISIYHSVPTVFRHLMETLGEGESFPSIRAADLGGEPVYRRDVEAFRRHFSSDCLLVNHLAFTEASVTAQYRMDAATVIETDRVCVGYPAAGMGIKILGDLGEELGLGEVGEMAVVSRYLSPGYWRQPELTAGSFTSVAGGEERIYRTGDLGRILSDGRVEHLGRKDARVKIRGYSIEVAEIEQALLRLGGLSEAAVVAREDTAGDPRLVAYLVSSVGEERASVSALRSGLGSFLPEYMLPSSFVWLASLPLTESGKVDRRALPAPDSADQESETPYVPPATDTERALSILWSQLLGVERVGIHDNFFHLGGHSLLVVRLFVQIEKQFGKRLPLSLLLQAPTVEALAAILDQNDWAPDRKCLVQIRVSGARPPFFWVHHAWGDILYAQNIVQHMSPDIPFYGLQSLGLDGKDAPLTRVEEMAALFVRELRSIQPEGPYYMGGHSAGAIIALEMAQQLHAVGEKTDLLVMLDPLCPVGSPYYPQRSRLFERTLIPWTFHAERHFLRLRRQGIKQYLRRRLREVGRAAAGQMQKLVGRGKGQELSETILRIWELNGQAVRSYRPRPYPGRITYFYASEPHPVRYGQTDTRLAWSAFADGGLEVHLIPGHHNSSVYEPHVKVLAEKLAVCLDRVYASHLQEETATK